MLVGPTSSGLAAGGGGERLVARCLEFGRVLVDEIRDDVGLVEPRRKRKERELEQLVPDGRVPAEGRRVLRGLGVGLPVVVVFPGFVFGRSSAGAAVTRDSEVSRCSAVATIPTTREA